MCELPAGEMRCCSTAPTSRTRPSPALKAQSVLKSAGSSGALRGVLDVVPAAATVVEAGAELPIGILAGPLAARDRRLWESSDPASP